MKKILAKLGPALVVGMLAVVPKADATLIPWGDPILGHSWDQVWNVNLGGQAFDTITATIVAPPATVFEAPGLRNFSVGSWTVTDAPHQTTATSAATTDPLQFYTHFSDNPDDYSSADPLLIELSFFNGSSLVEGYSLSWNGSSWAPSAALGVPDGGATLVLLGLSAFGLVFARRRLK